MGNPVMAIGWPVGEPRANARGESKVGRPLEAPLPSNYSDPFTGVRPERSGARAAEDSYLVDSASSHMLVSRIKPCMPQNNCIAGICAWLITSDVICRNSFAVSALLDNLAKCQANT